MSDINQVGNLDRILRENWVREMRAWCERHPTVWPEADLSRLRQMPTDDILALPGVLDAKTKPDAGHAVYVHFHPEEIDDLPAYLRPSVTAAAA